MKATTWIVVSIITVILLNVIWPPDPDRPDAEFLATDAYFLVGEEPITLPFVAVSSISMPQGITNPLPRFRNDARRFETRNYKKTFLQRASNSTSPMHVATIYVSYGTYQSYGEHTASGAICDLLTREWAKQICNNERSGILAHIPRSITLVDRKSMLTLQNLPFSENVTEQIMRLKLDIGNSEVVCDSETGFCKGVVSITNKLMVIWGVANSHTQSETATEIANRQGAALFKLVTYGFGKTENVKNILQD